MNKDLRNEMVESAKNAINSGDVEAFVNQMVALTDEAKNEVIRDYKELKDCKDKEVLAKRGYFDLTSNEKEFLDNMIASAKNMSIPHPDRAIPEEFISRVFEDIERSHPLLAHVNIVATSTVNGKIVYNTGLGGTATWGDLCATISSEITSDFVFRTFAQHKLSAYMEVCKTLIDLGYTWLERYVRMCLGEALARALENAIINGTGSQMPLGLSKVIADAGQTQTIPAADKQAITLTELSAASLGAIAATLSKNGTRVVSKMIMAVNPLDYYSKVIPAVRLMNAEGKWVEFVPFPMEFVPVTAVAANSAVIFRDFGYTATIGLGTEGKVEKSEEYKFYEDLVCFKIKLVGDGTPNDNNESVVADITNLAPVAFNVNNLGN